MVMGETSDATKPIGAPVLQFSVFLRNRAGALESVIRLLHQSRVEMLGFSVQDSSDATVARIVTSDPETTQQIFLEKGIPHTTSKLVVVALRNAAEEMQRCLRELHLAETNIDFGYNANYANMDQYYRARFVHRYDLCFSLGRYG